MAKHPRESETSTSPAENPQPTLTPAVSTVPDERYVMLTTDGRYGTNVGAQVKRIDLIRALWVNQKLSRGTIAKYLTELSGKKIPYQIVFSGTKGLTGGPDKVVAAAPVAAPTS